MNKLSWDEYFIRMAMLTAMKSKDPSTKVGVVIVRDNSVLSTGFNGFPRGVGETAWVGPSDHEPEHPGRVLHPERWERPAKYQWVEHAERNAIYQAAKMGHRTNNAVMYFNTAGEPCSDCTRAIIQAGIREIITRDVEGGFTGHGQGTHYHCGEVERTMLAEAGVLHRKVPDFAPCYRYTAPFTNSLP